MPTAAPEHLQGAGAPERLRAVGHRPFPQPGHPHAHPACQRGAGLWVPVSLAQDRSRPPSPYLDYCSCLLTHPRPLPSCQNEHVTLLLSPPMTSPPTESKSQSPGSGMGPGLAWYHYPNLIFYCLPLLGSAPTTWASWLSQHARPPPSSRPMCCHAFWSSSSQQMAVLM